MKHPTENIDVHLQVAATWVRRDVINHIENDHGGVADWDEPWVNHRKVHWRDTQNAQSDARFHDAPELADGSAPARPRRKKGA